MIEDIVIYICVSYCGFTDVGKCHSIVSCTDWVVLLVGRVTASDGMSSFGPKGVCTHTGKTAAGSDSIAGCNVNKWVLSHAAGPAELPAQQICVQDWNSTSRTPHRHLLCAAYQFQCTALQLAHVSEPVGVLNTSVCL